MSKIAEALAKAKERTGHTAAPFMTGATALPAEILARKEAALRRARRLQRFWLLLSSVALVLTGFILWTQFSQEDYAGGRDVPAAGAQVSEPAPNSLVQSSRIELVTEAPVPVVLPTETSEVPESGEGAGPAPRLELQTMVNDFVFTAVMPGERPRLMFNGRIVGVGERVAGELVFAGIHHGRLVFNDAQGAIYLRRY
jgi:hypothetical protein